MNEQHKSISDAIKNIYEFSFAEAKLLYIHQEGESLSETSKAIHLLNMCLVNIVIKEIKKEKALEVFDELYKSGRNTIEGYLKKCQ